MAADASDARRQVLARLASLRQNQNGGHRAPHKPLLVLLALGQLTRTGSSALSWSDAQVRLADLIAQFGPPSRTGRRQSAAYPFTRLRSDGVWELDRKVPMDLVGPLDQGGVTGRLTADLERSLHRDPELLHIAARRLVESHFPATIAPDVLGAVGLDSEAVLDDVMRYTAYDRDTTRRRRSAGWRAAVLRVWGERCAFCGYDGRLGSTCVGIDAAHVRWFAFAGPDSLDNGLALCVLHHKLFDLGVIGLKPNGGQLQLEVSAMFTANYPAGLAVKELDGRKLEPRSDTDHGHVQRCSTSPGRDGFDRVMQTPCTGSCARRRRLRRRRELVLYSLDERTVTDRLAVDMEQSLRQDHHELHAAAHSLPAGHLPTTVAVDLLSAVGLARRPRLEEKYKTGGKCRFGVAFLTN